MINGFGIRFLLTILLFTFSSGRSFAAEWKGIVPGVSTRSDIIAAFQKCSDRGAPCEFDLDGDQIRIVFSGTVQDDFYQCTKSLPTDTVLVVEVTPRIPIPLADLRRSHRLRRLGSASKFGAYVDERSGVVLKSFENKVIQLNYIAAAADRNRCADYYADPMQFARVVTHCPPVTLVSLSKNPRGGEAIDLQANVQPDPKLVLVWAVSDGKIVAQAGQRISVDTTGLGGKSLKITVQARGACAVENSVTLNIQP